MKIKNLSPLFIFTFLFLTGCSNSHVDISPKENTSNKIIEESSEKDFQIDVWADNWFAAYLGNELLLEDSVPITTERSFNGESKTFSANYPLNLNFIIKDFKENDTGLEYIGTTKQQMGDGGFIMQLTDKDSGAVIGVSNSDMKCIVLHEAPLNKNCEKSDSPSTDSESCGFVETAEPTNWKDENFDDSTWQNATEYSEKEVSPKDGYDQISWDSKAKLIWGDDLETNNTLLCRMTIKDALESHDDVHSYEGFESFENVHTHTDDEYLHIESNGIPEHGMMKGITSWQQQVAIAQDYTGDNSWKIPLNPEIAEVPLSTQDHFHKGAIAVAVNGVPIFNALNNRGEYSADIGELDEWGGHSGRADDYHYHKVPTHLEAIVGTESPLAYALDGFPVYGETTEVLDEFLGRFTEDDTYQYHALGEAPYLIAAFKGQVEVDSFANAPEDQIVPQAQSKPVRTKEYGPLNGATITNFEKISDTEYILTYEIKNETYSVQYSWDESGNYIFVFTDPEGEVTTENHSQSSTQQRSQTDRTEPKDRNTKNPPNGNDAQQKYCGDGICDSTETYQQCPLDCN